jgi:hypothetical protein
MLFETSTVTFLDRNKRYGDLVKFGADRYQAKLDKKAKKLTDDERKKYLPKIDDMIPFFQNNMELWGAAKSSHLKHSLSEMGKYQPKLNGVLHNPWQPINKSEAFQIRDAVLPLLRHLIET